MFGNWEMSHVEDREPVDTKTRKFFLLFFFMFYVYIQPFGL